MNKIDLRDLRHLNLMRLIDEKFAGHQADFATAVKKNPTQVNHWVSRHRNPNGDTCRDVEQELGFKSGWLDQDHSHEISPALAAQLQNSESSNPPLAPINKAQAAINNIAYLRGSIEFLAGYLSGMDATTRRRAGGLLAELADDPKSHAQITEMLEAAIRSGRPAETTSPASRSAPDQRQPYVSRNLPEPYEIALENERRTKNRRG